MTEIKNLFHPPTAFPMNCEYVDDNGVLNRLIGTGMSLRDYFAAQALMGAVCNKRISGDITASLDEIPLTDSERFIANACYRMADAMLKERAK